MLHCPHCLNNWPCLEPLEACVRRNIYIRNRRGSYRSRPKTSVRRETTPGDVSKLTIDTSVTHLDVSGEWDLLHPSCDCSHEEQAAGHAGRCSRKQWLRIRRKSEEFLNMRKLRSCSGQASTAPRRETATQGEEHFFGRCAEGTIA